MLSQKKIDVFSEVLFKSQINKPENYPKKYTKAKNMFKKARRILKKVSKHGKNRRGLDVGCAHGSVSILAPKFGLVIVGLDITPSVYTSSQENLQQMGYPITLYSKLPLSMFKDNEFDFIIMFRTKCSRIDKVGRADELSRILKNNGIWYIAPSRHRGSFIRGLTPCDKKHIFKSL